MKNDLGLLSFDEQQRFFDEIKPKATGFVEWNGKIDLGKCTTGELSRWFDGLAGAPVGSAIEERESARALAEHFHSFLQQTLLQMGERNVPSTSLLYRSVHQEFLVLSDYVVAMERERRARECQQADLLSDEWELGIADRRAGKSSDL